MHYIKGNLKANLFLVGAIFSMIGNSTLRISFFWYAANNLDSKELVSLIGIALFLPALLLSPITGWLADKQRSPRLLLVTQILSASLLLIVANIKNQSWPIHLMIPISLLLSIFGAYCKCFTISYSRKIVGSQNIEKIVVAINTVTASMMVIAPALVSIPLTFPTISFELIFYLNSLCYLIFAIFLFFMPTTDTRTHSRTIISHLSKSVSAVISDKKMRINYISFLLTHFSFGSIAVTLPILFSERFFETAGAIYGSLEITGGIVAIFISIYFYKLKNHWPVLYIATTLFYLINYYHMNEFTLYPMVIFAFGFSVMQVMMTNITFFSFDDESIVGGLRSILTMGQAASASLSCAFCYYLIEFNLTSISLLISSLSVATVILLSIFYETLNNTQSIKAT